LENWKIAPKSTYVATYIDCYWLLERLQSDTGSEYPKLNPDPAAHLILAGSQQHYQYEQGAIAFAGRGSHLILPHCKTFVMDHSQSFLVVGVKFHVGALYSLNFPANQRMLDQVNSIDVQRLFNVEKFNETDLLNSAVAQADLSQAELTRDALDELLTPFVLDCYEDKHSRLMQGVLAIVSNTAISKIGAELGCSQRTVERSFSRVTGFTLKQFQSMDRLEVMLNYLHTLADNHINWSDVAARFGFSDQPHLIRYLKSNIGNTPGEYVKRRDLAIDAYGDFE